MHEEQEHQSDSGIQYPTTGTSNNFSALVMSVPFVSTRRKKFYVRLWEKVVIFYCLFATLKIENVQEWQKMVYIDEKCKPFYVS